MNHCQLDAPEHKVKEFAARLRQPTYYETTLSPEQNAIVEEEAADTMRLYGYGVFDEQRGKRIAGN